MQDLRFALRRLRRAPAFTLTSILVLTLAAGASAAVFSLLRGLVLRPLPVPHPEQLAQITTRDRQGREGDLTWRQFVELSRRQRAFSALIGSIGQGTATVETAHGTVRASFSGVTGNYYGELGASPLQGRLLSASDVSFDAPDARSPVAVIGWSLWQRHFNSDPSVVGQTIHVEGLPVTVVGVAPQGFLGLGVTIEHDVTIPITLFPKVVHSDRALIEGAARWIGATGRLAEGTTLASARAQIQALWPALREAATPADLSPAQQADYRALDVSVDSGSRGVERGLRGRYTQPLVTLLAIAGIVLLFAAVNLGSLVIVRVEAARAELGVKLALGAPRGRLIRETALQGMLIGTAGAAGAAIFASYASRQVAAFLLHDYLVPTSLDVAPDRVAIASTAAVCIGIGGAICALAAWWVTRSAAAALTPGGTRSVTGAARTGRVLVGVQVAVAIVLLTDASLLGRNLYNLTAGNRVASGDVLVGSASPLVGAYQGLDPEPYYREALARVRAVPGVQAASFSQYRPARGAVTQDIAGHAATPIGTGDVGVETTTVSPGFFDTIGLALLQGRDFDFSDGARAGRVAIVSRHAAEQLFGPGRGLGERIRVSSSPELQDLRVVGIAADAPVFDVRRGNDAIVYLPALQRGTLAHYKFLVLRAPASVVPEVAKALASLGRETLEGVSTVDYIRGRTLMQERLLAAIGGYFGLVSLVLMAAGVHGLVSYVLSLRRREIAIRMALGADARRIGSSILFGSLHMAVIGLAAGLVAAIPTLRLIRSVLVATRPTDPVAIAGASLVLIVVVAVATLSPARRGALVEPLVELRRE
jgi:predicted permease